MPLPGEFRPLLFLGNPHLQTIVSMWVRGGPLPGETVRRIVALTDGDRLVLHDNTPPRWSAGKPIAMLLHGLTGSHASSSIVRFARALLAKDIRVIRVDLRGA